MRILNLCSNRWNSAITEYALNTSRALALAGHDVLNLGTDDKPFCKRSRELGLATRSVSSFKVTQFGSFSRIFDQFNPELIIVHGGPEMMMAALCHFENIPTIRVKGYSDRKSTPKNTQSMTLIQNFKTFLKYPRVQALVYPSYSTQGSPITYPRTKRIMLGIDAKLFHKMAPWQQPKRPTLLIFGRLDPVKGHREFMSIFKNLSIHFDHGMKPRLLIVGLPANLGRTELEDHAESLKLELPIDVEIITERIQNTRQLLESVSVGVISSIGSEDICRVAQEFLMCGTPILVTAAGGLKEVLVKESFGACLEDLVEPSGAKLANKVLNYHLEGDDVRKLRATESKSCFSLERMRDDWELLIKELHL